MKKVINSLIIFNDWLDQNSNYKFGVVVTWMLCGGLFLNFSHSMIGILIGISFYCTAGVMALFRVRVSSGKVQFDYDVYGSPNVGDVIRILKPFYCSRYALPNPNFTWWHIGKKKIRVFSDVDRITGLLKLFPQSPGVIEFINEGSEWQVERIEKQDNDIIMTLRSVNSDQWCEFSFFECRDYWMDKSEIRSKRLKNIGIILTI